jgi:hypothetical protein
VGRIGTNAEERSWKVGKGFGKVWRSGKVREKKLGKEKNIIGIFEKAMNRKIRKTKLSCLCVCEILTKEIG